MMIGNVKKVQQVWRQWVLVVVIWGGVIGVVVGGGVVGCQAYVLKGKVICDGENGVEIVDADDVRLSEAGVEGVTVELVLDPRSLRREKIGEVVSKYMGDFEVDVDAVGAGVLEYEIGVTAHGDGYKITNGIIKLPSADKWLLIIMEQGVNRYQRDDDFMKDIERFGMK